MAAPRRHTRDRPRRGAAPARRVRFASGACSTPRPRRAGRWSARLRPRRWRPSHRSFAALLAATLAWLDGRPADAAGGRDVLVLGDPRYPAALLETADPPTLLYVDGRIELLAADSIAIVGSRNPTAQGAGERPRLRQPPQPGRAGGRLRAGARHRRRRPRGRPGRPGRGRGRRDDRGRRHRPRPRLPGTASGAGAPDRRRRPAGQRVPDRHRLPAGELPDQESHHRRPGARHPGGRGGDALRLADHRPARPGGRPRGVRHSRVDPLAPGARLQRLI